MAAYRAWSGTEDARSFRSSMSWESSSCETKSLRDFHGHGPSIQSLTGWPFNFRYRANPGKLSSNGPRFPPGYQIKWAIPSDAKSSPLFQEVNPDTVPAHSFFQIRWPISVACVSDISKARTDGATSKSISRMGSFIVWANLISAFCAR